MSEGIILQEFSMDGVRLTMYAWRGCKIGISREFDNKWHMSISHRDRYPTWDEIRDARYAFIPNAVTMAMILPPKEQYVNVHENCFHLHEIEGE